MSDFNLPMVEITKVLETSLVYDGEAIPFVLEGEQATTDVDNAKGQSPWAELRVRHSGGTRTTVGPKGERIYRSPGLGFLDIRCPKYGGAGVGTEIATTIVDAINVAPRTAGFHFTPAARMSELGLDETDDELIYQVEIPFYLDTTGA